MLAVVALVLAIAESVSVEAAWFEAMLVAGRDVNCVGVADVSSVLTVSMVLATPLLLWMRQLLIAASSPWCLRLHAAISGVAFAVVGVVKDSWFRCLRLGLCGFGGGLSVVSCRCCQ